MTTPPELHRGVGRLNRDAAPDGELLARFVEHRDEVAFAALARRHAAMVLGTCRRVLGNAADADDAFQAAFVVLVRRAGALTGRACVGNFLYGVAFRTALKVKAMVATRRKHEARVQPPDPHPDHAEILTALDEELARLPEKYRAPVVLCELEGRPRRAVAEALGVAEGTISSRLAAAHRTLEKRLRARGFAGIALTAVLATQRGAVADSFTETAVRAATSPPLVVSRLASEVTKMMLLHKLGIGAGGFAVVFVAAAALAANGRGPDGPRDPEPPKVAKADSASRPDTAPPPRAVNTDDGKATFEFLADAKQAADVPILMKVVMTNSGKKPLRYWTSDGINPPMNRQTKCRDESGKVREVWLSSGGDGLSGVHKELAPGQSLVIPVILEPLPKGTCSLDLDGGVFKFVVVDDPELRQQRLRDLLRRRDNGERIARHAVTAYFTQPLRELCLRDLSGADEEKALAALHLLSGRSELPKGAVGVLVRAIDKQLKTDQPDYWVLRSLAESGGRIGSDEALDAVIRLVRDDKSIWAGCTALGLFKQERAATELKKLLKHKDDHVRGAAAAMLAERNDPNAIETLIDVARSGTGGARWAACNALANYPNDPRAEDTIRSCLDEHGGIGGITSDALNRLQAARNAQKNNP